MLLSAYGASSIVAQVRWDDEILRQPTEWYRSAEARAAANTVIQYQSSEGGWQKNTDLLTPPTSREGLERPTIDNGATTTPIRFLGLVANATGEPKYILRSQVEQNGQLTAWCAQHDEQTLEPAWARAYEPPSLSGGETVGLVRFLMSVDEPTPEIVAAIEGAVRWLRSVAISGVRVDRIRRADGRLERVLVADPDASPLWARFYELGTNRPLYLDRDSVYRYDYSKIGYERRSGYDYHGTWAATLLDKDHLRWRAQHGRR